MSPQIAILGFVKGNDKSFLIKNMILMVFKLYVYKARVSGKLNFNTFLHELVKVKNVEKGAVFSNKQKHDMFFKEMVYCRKSVATIKKSFVIYNMNNNSQIETENSGRGLVLYFVDFSFCYYFMYLFFIFT